MMGKKSKSRSDVAAEHNRGDNVDPGPLSLLAANAAIDPALASLFEKSAGAAQVKPTERKQHGRGQKIARKAASDAQVAGQDGVGNNDDVPGDSDTAGNPAVSAAGDANAGAQRRKRKRAGVLEDDFEEVYLRRLAREEERESAKHHRRLDAEASQSHSIEDAAVAEPDDSSMSDVDVGVDAASENSEQDEKPLHESISGASSKADEIEKSKRTVFLGNVSTKAITSKSAKKALLKHLVSFLDEAGGGLSASAPQVESIRFRSTPFASGGGLPKRASFARKEILDETTPSTNAYVVYSTAQAARKAPAALNGTIVLDRHLRVDSVAHPSATDHRRCVFVGNLAFVDSESDAADGDAKRDSKTRKSKKPAAPADVEEGLWRVFNAHAHASNPAAKGSVESVRVVRDRATRVGKGFAYVQFYDENCVEQALLLDGKKFPPMLPRSLRVTRAKKIKKKSDATAPSTDRRPQRRVLGQGSAQQTMQGRAAQLLGRSRAAQLKTRPPRASEQRLVFEGQRASEHSGAVSLSVKRQRKGKPKNHGTKRAAAYRQSRSAK